MPKTNPLFTVFTGTYNSEEIIDRVFQSVKHQTMRDFEWIVVDDYSKDGTLLRLGEFISSIDDISVRIIRHSVNKGVSYSRKEALDIAKGKYFVTWDHDDVQSSNQLEIFRQYWNENPVPSVGSIFAKIEDQHGKILGQKFPKQPFVSDYINMHNKYLVKRGLGVVEHHVCSKTVVYRLVLEYFERNGLMREYLPNGGDVWGTMAFLGYKTMYINQVVRTYYIGEADRATMSDRSRKDGALRIYLNKLIWVNYWHKSLTKISFKWFVRNHFALVMYGFLSNKNLIEIVKDIKSKYSVFLAVIISFPAFILANIYSRKKRS